MFEQGSPDARRGTLLVQGQTRRHGSPPTRPHAVACSGHSGLLQLDYSEQRLLMRMFDKLLGHVAFSPNGKLWPPASPTAR